MSWLRQGGLLVYRVSWYGNEEINTDLTQTFDWPYLSHSNYIYLIFGFLTGLIIYQVKIILLQSQRSDLFFSRYSNLHHRVWCFLLIIHSQIGSGFHRNSESLRQCVLKTNFQVSGDSQIRLQTKNIWNDKIYKSIIK